MIRVATYNIRKAIGTDRVRKPARILEVIGEVGADIVALQEADRRFGSRVSAIPQDLIIHHSRYHVVPFETKTDGIGWHGNAILVDDSIHIADHDIIDIPSLEPRGAVFAELYRGDWHLRIVAMHLDLSGLLRRRQLRTIFTYLKRRKQVMPTLLMGDLNEWSRKGGALKEIPHEYRIAHSEPSFHAQRPIAQLDRIITGSGITVGASGTHHSATARSASDHLPVWADLYFD
ncbi:MAG: endonuclease/exonuclease/phosphatase family protein [Pseudomonadota bacterium]